VDGAIDKRALIEHYSTWAPQMQNLDHFYEWVLREIERTGVPRDTSVLDIGCGTGALLARMAEQGYARLTGVDFSPGCLELAHAALENRHVDLYLHDIEEDPVNQQFDLILMSTVIDFLVDPATALEHARMMLSDDGSLLVTIRNRIAYWPWYYLKPIVTWSGWPSRISHWLQWFCLPLPMRRTDQSYERIYTPFEMRRLLHATGFWIESERASLYVPMLHIPGTGKLERMMNTVDQRLQALPANPLAYQYMFICRKSR
jgi:SAM-dependent methyltransferase